MASPARSTPGDGGAAALRVLTQRSLLQRIAGFMPGLPYLVGEFEASIAGSTDYPGSLPQAATRRRNLAMLQRLFRLSQSDAFRRVPKLQFHGVTRCAVQYNAAEILRWIASVRDGDPSAWPDAGSGLLAAAVTSYFDDPWTLNWVASHLDTQRAVVSLQEVCAAAAIGNVNAVTWLHTHGRGTFSPMVMDTAAAHGHLALVQFLHANRREGCTARAIHGAAVHNYADVVEFLGEHRREGPEDRTLAVAASDGHLRVVETLCRVSTRGCLHDAYKSAVEWGHTEVAALLQSQMDPGVRWCSLERHKHAREPRRCQRTPAAVAPLEVEAEMSSPRTNSARTNEDAGKRSGVDQKHAARWLGWMCR